MPHDDSGNSLFIKPLKLLAWKALCWPVSSFRSSPGEDVGAPLLPSSTAGSLGSFFICFFICPHSISLSRTPRASEQYPAVASVRSRAVSSELLVWAIPNFKLPEGRSWGLFMFASSELEPKSPSIYVDSMPGQSGHTLVWPLHLWSCLVSFHGCWSVSTAVDEGALLASATVGWEPRMQLWASGPGFHCKLSLVGALCMLWNHQLVKQMPGGSRLPVFRWQPCPAGPWSMHSPSHTSFSVRPRNKPFLFPGSKRKELLKSDEKNPN